MYRSHVLVCGGTGCTSSGSAQIIQTLEQEIAKNGLVDEVKVVKTGCFGLCALGPIMIVYPEGCFYSAVKPEDIPEIVEQHLKNGIIVTRLLYQETVPEIVSEHLLKGRIVKRLLYSETVEDSNVKSLNETEFYKKQHRVALKNCGVINPENIEEYIGVDGYAALGKVLTEMTPEEVIKVIKDSGLRGRGGGGFPTGLKWESAHKQAADTKYVVCNADEGDPGAFMDRSIMEGDPHSIVEAMTICGYAIGSRQGLVYIRAEYPLAIQRLKTAIAQAREYGLLGERILGTDFCFDIEIRYGAGAFVCGEGSALTTSIEGNRGMPRVKPPRTVEHGLFDKPTVLNNVETFCNVPPILLNGAKWYQGYGPANNHGTKAFALTGNVQNTGLIEVPMGTTLREVIFDIGGGVKGGAFKAVQIGGPSGGCLCISATEDHLDMKLDFDSLKKVGAMIGSGGLVVMNDKSCSGTFLYEFYPE